MEKGPEVYTWVEGHHLPGKGAWVPETQQQADEA